MKAFFNWLTEISLRFRWITLLSIVVIMVAGGIAGTRLQQELLPPVEFPQTFILATVSGMTSEQTLNVVTARLEEAIASVPEIVNISSTTNGAFGAFIVAANDFGLNQQRLQNQIKAAIDTVWFPQRSIQPNGQDPKMFAATLMADLNPETLIYIGHRNPTFFFQLTPQVWENLAPTTIETILAYLANQRADSSEQSLLERLVEQEVVPQLNGIAQVASVQISGGQALPGEGGAAAVRVEGESPLLLLQLTPEVWQIAQSKLSDLGSLDEATTTRLSALPFSIPETAPALPASWQMDRFTTAQDLIEMGNVAGVLNTFMETGVIKGAPGQMSDLTADDIRQMLAIDPTMVEYFEAEHLVAMSPEVFAALPQDFIDGLDGFTRDALTAKALAESLTGATAERAPVNLPGAWRIQPPGILTFSFASLPLATFSVFDTSSTAAPATETPAETPAAAAETGGGTAALTQVFALVGGLFQGNADTSLQLADAWSTLAQEPQFAGRPLRTADDVLALGDGSAAAVLNQINDSVPAAFAGYEVRLFDSLTPEIINHFAAQEEAFFTRLEPAVLLKFSPAALAALPDTVLAGLDEATAAQVRAIADGSQPPAAAALGEQYTVDIPPADPAAPALAPIWTTVGDRLGGIELDSADDFFRFPPNFVYATPAEMMNDLIVNAGSFAPQIFGPLTVDNIQYMLTRDPAVFDTVSVDVLVLLAPDVQAALPEAVRQRLAEGEVFRPTTQVTRTNGASSLLVTVFKEGDANTVEAYYAVKALIDRINAQDPNIEVSVAFEQSSFIEKSISGVVKEGTLGAVFAIVVILVFLSGDSWKRRGRFITGTVMAAFFAALLAGVVLLNLESAGGDVAAAFEISDILIRLLAILGLLAALFIIFFPGGLPYPAWRSTLVIAVSIPLSLFAGLALMYWLPPAVNNLLSPLADSSPLVTFILRLFPASLTLNIMTLSGLTVAIGRVVDDSIVVLENIFRQIQSGIDKKEAILSGTRDVSVAIFAATGVAVVVFLPLGLTGGLIGEFFLPFGLAVTYALIASFFVAITVVPVLAYLFISAEDVPHEEETILEKTYVPALKAAMSNNLTRVGVIVLALISFVVGVYLFSQRPFAFIPAFGEPQIDITVELPSGTKIVDTNALVAQMETYLQENIAEDELITVRTIIGGGGLGLESLVGGGGGVTENRANIVVGIESQSYLDTVLPDIRARAEAIFGEGNVIVAKQTLASGGGFGGFELFVTGNNQDELAALDARIIEVLSEVEGLTNVTSNLSQVAAAGGGEGGSITYLRTDSRPSVSYTAELETENTIGVTQNAIEAIRTGVELPAGVTVGQGFNSELQSSGFVGVFVAMGIAVLIVVIILVFEFGSPIYWLAVILSISVAPVGAAIALALTDTVLGISALIGLLMLLGLAVTNAVVLIDRVGSNRYERGMGLYEAIIEAGGRRVRPILMTAVATITALLPLAVGLSEGAIIADSLGKVVIGGMISSTLLTLIVVPA
ncbi:MAG: efflux RND transporter permease subunit, partial [Anaerolineae bacterium]|nr:efflux RND transporter permease subunit [Anaerolineae bacterium]